MHPIETKVAFKRLAQMAESVDALVSNTSGATRAGSTPALGTKYKRSPVDNTFTGDFNKQNNYN